MATRARFHAKAEAAGYWEAMSRENVEVVRRAIEAVTRRPKPDFATVNELYDPDHEYVSRIEALEGGARRGARGYREWLADAEEAFDWESRLERVTQIDETRVLAVTPTRIRGKHSGVVVEDRELACLVTLRAGKIIRSELFLSPAEALEAVGLSE